MEALVYAANFLYLGSYLVRDLLHLRLLTIVAACCLAAYFYNQDEPMMTVVGWNLFFIGMNVFQLTRIFVERATVASEDASVTSDSDQANAGPSNIEILSGIAKI
jgi:hypothetical protein